LTLERQISAIEITGDASIIILAKERGGDFKGKIGDKID
jgi:hypothetical protein